MKVTIHLSDEIAERYRRQAKRYDQTVMEYIMSWADSGLRSDEYDAGGDDEARPCEHFDGRHGHRVCGECGEETPE